VSTRMPYIALGAVFLAVPAGLAGLAGNAEASGTSTMTRTAATAAAVRDCPDVANRDVGQGDTGDYVKEVQCLLNWAVAPTTYHRIAVDGDFGTDTGGKVTKFQQCYNDQVDPDLGVDGRIGPQTAPALETWAASKQYVC
jgi:zinc D-Ala-D-Ala carboxypeptidase